VLPIVCEVIVMSVVEVMFGEFKGEEDKRWMNDENECLLCLMIDISQGYDLFHSKLVEAVALQVHKSVKYFEKNEVKFYFLRSGSSIFKTSHFLLHSLSFHVLVLNHNGIQLKCELPPNHRQISSTVAAVTVAKGTNLEKLRNLLKNCENEINEEVVVFEKIDGGELQKIQDLSSLVLDSNSRLFVGVSGMQKSVYLIRMSWNKETGTMSFRDRQAMVSFLKSKMVEKNKKTSAESNVNETGDGLTAEDEMRNNEESNEGDGMRDGMACLASSSTNPRTNKRQRVYGNNGS
jgi:hypothetical protein